MRLFDDLRELGVDIDEGLKRLNGNEALYTRLLGTFVKTIEKYYVPVDFDGNDYGETTEKAHAIKGASGNLSITPLYEAYTKIVELLRAGDPDQARMILTQIQPVQNSIMQCIEKHMQ